MHQTPEQHQRGAFMPVALRTLGDDFHELSSVEDAWIKGTGHRAHTTRTHRLVVADPSLLIKDICAATNLEFSQLGWPDGVHLQCLAISGSGRVNVCNKSFSKGCRCFNRACERVDKGCGNFYVDLTKYPEPWAKGTDFAALAADPTSLPWFAVPTLGHALLKDLTGKDNWNELNSSERLVAQSAHERYASVFIISSYSVDTDNNDNADTVTGHLVRCIAALLTDQKSEPVLSAHKGSTHWQEWSAMDAAIVRKIVDLDVTSITHH